MVEPYYNNQNAYFLTNNSPQKYSPYTTSAIPINSNAGNITYNYDNNKVIRIISNNNNNSYPNYLTNINLINNNNHYTDSLNYLTNSKNTPFQAIVSNFDYGTNSYNNPVVTQNLTGPTRIPENYIIQEIDGKLYKIPLNNNINNMNNNFNNTIPTQQIYQQNPQLLHQFVQQTQPIVPPQQPKIIRIPNNIIKRENRPNSPINNQNNNLNNNNRINGKLPQNKQIELKDIKTDINKNNINQNNNNKIVPNNNTIINRNVNNIKNNQLTPNNSPGININNQKNNATYISSNIATVNKITNNITNNKTVSNINPGTNNINQNQLIPKNTNIAANNNQNNINAKNNINNNNLINKQPINQNINTNINKQPINPNINNNNINLNKQPINQNINNNINTNINKQAINQNINNNITKQQINQNVNNNITNQNQNIINNNVKPNQNIPNNNRIIANQPQDNFATVKKIEDGKANLPAPTPIKKKVLDRGDYFNIIYKDIGMINLGNTCFINSCLQVLIHCPLFIHKFFDKYDSLDKNKNDIVISRYFYDVCTSMVNTINTQEKYIDITNFKTVFGTKHQMFEGYLQNDSQEFCRIFLEDLSTELNEIKNKTLYRELTNSLQRTKTFKDKEYAKNFTEREKSIITETFYSQIITTFTCKCRFNNYSFQKLLDFPLLLPKNINQIDIISLLKIYCQTEIIDFERKCENCHKIEQHQKEIKISSPPEILILSLQRIDPSTQKKNECIVTFPEILDIKDFIDHECKHDSETVYNLFAVINHKGNIDSGHYFSYIKFFKTVDWYLFNDSSVKKLEKKPENFPFAYALFYIKDKYIK